MIDATSIFDTIVIRCDCVNGLLFNASVVQQTGLDGDGIPSGDSSLTFSVPSGLQNRGVFDHIDTQVAQVITRVRAGSARVYYFDVGSGTGFWSDQIPVGLEWLRNLHPFHATDSWRRGGSDGSLYFIPDGESNLDRNRIYAPAGSVVLFVPDTREVQVISASEFDMRYSVVEEGE